MSLAAALPNVAGAGLAMEPFHYGTTMYVSTVSGLPTPLKITVDAGHYTPGPYLDGSIFKKVDYNPKTSEIIHVLNERDGDCGLVGTYHTGDTEDESLVKMVNDHFLMHFNYEFKAHLFGWYYDYEEKVYIEHEEDEDEDDYYYYYDSSEDSGCEDLREERGNRTHKLTELPSYNNIPVLFFLNTAYDIENMTLENKYEDPEHKIVVWNVIDDVNGKIGVAILQDKFYNMMGDQMGLAVFSQNGTSGVAFANFDGYKHLYNKDTHRFDEVAENVFYPQNESGLRYNHNRYWTKRRQRWLLVNNNQ